MPGSLLGNVVRGSRTLSCSRGGHLRRQPPGRRAAARRLRPLDRRPRRDRVDRHRGGAAPARGGGRAHRRRPRPSRRTTRSCVLNAKPCRGRRSPRDRVRFVGDTVAVVVAETAGHRRATPPRRSIVDYEPLAVGRSTWRRPSHPTPRCMFDGVPGNLIAGQRERRPTTTLLAGADVVVRGRFENQRIAVVPMEGNAIAVVPGDRRRRPRPHRPRLHPDAPRPRGQVARRCSSSDRAVRVIAPHVGGGVRRQGRPARRARRRHRRRPPPRPAGDVGRDPLREHGGHAPRPGPGAVRRDGLHQRRHHRRAAGAGWSATPAPTPASAAALLLGPTRTMAQGVYRIPKIAFDGAVAATNTTPMGAFRGAGRPEAAALLERIMDIAADELGIDPVELRRTQPAPTPTCSRYTTLDRRRPTTAATTTPPLDEAAARRRLRRAAGRAGRPPRAGRPAAARHRRERLRRDHRRRRRQRVRRGRGPRRRHRHDQGRHVGARPGPRHVVRHARGRPARHPDGVDPVRPVRHRPWCPAAVAPAGRGRCSSAAAPCAGAAEARAGAGQGARRPTCSRPTPTTSWSTDDGRLGVAGVPRPGAVTWAELATAAPRPTAASRSLAELDFAAGRAPTFPFGAHVAVVEVDARDRPGPAPAPRRRRRLRPDPQPAARRRPAARRHRPGHRPRRCGRRSSTTPTATRSPPTWPTTPCRRRPSCRSLRGVATPRRRRRSTRSGAKGIGESGTIGSTPAVQNAVVDALAPPRRAPHRHAVHARAGVEGDPGRRARYAAPRRGGSRRRSSTGCRNAGRGPAPPPLTSTSEPGGGPGGVLYGP